MAHFYRAQVTIPMDTGLAADASTNTWHFDADDDVLIDETTRTDHIVTRLRSFYSTVSSACFPTIMATLATVKIYKLTDPEPRFPVAENTIPLNGVTGTPLPSEVALCLSYQGARESGTNVSRRRGRIYIGPLVSGAAIAGTGGSRPSSTVISAIATAAATLTATPAGPGRPLWAVFSPTTLSTGGSLDDAFEDVESGWVDDAWDIQRRRCLAATSRTNWT
jgi:hypothetical protein